MPAKRKAAQKSTPPAESSRPSRSTPSKAGAKRKASPSPAPPAKKGVGARKEASDNDAKESSRQSTRGRSSSRQTEIKQKEEPKPSRGSSRTSHATRAVVEAEESKKASSRGRSKTPSASQKNNTTQKSTPKSKIETPKQKATPRAATPRQRSATPKSKPSTPKQATPKQKTATPKQKVVTAKQRSTTPKQKAAPPKSKQEKQKSTPKQKPSPKQKQKSTPVKSPSKKTTPKKEESPKNESESTTEPDVKKSPDSAKKRKTPTKRESPPTKPARTSSRSRGKEEKAGEETTDQDEQTDKTQEETIENKNSEAAEVESEPKKESEEKPSLENQDDKKDKTDEKEDESEAMETEEAANEDENVEQDQIVEKNENTEAEDAAVEESKESEAADDKVVEAESPQKVESMEIKETEDEENGAKVEEESKAVEEAEAEEAEAEEDKDAKTAEEEEEAEEEDEAEAAETEKVEIEEKEKAEAEEEENAEAEEEEKAEAEEEEKAELVQEPVAESRSSQKDEASEPDISSMTAETSESVQNVDDVKESQAESEQVVLEDKENESVESEQVEADAQEPVADTIAGDPIVINEDSGDSAQPEIISDESENGDGKVIELNDDSGDAVIVMDSNEMGSGDNDNTAKVNEEEKVLNAEAAAPVVNLDDNTGVELGEEAIENDFASTSDLTGNGTSHLEDIESKKRKIDEVEDAEDSGEFSKKAKSSVEVESVTENGTVSQEEENVDDDFVVIEMSDVPPTDSNEVKESIPQEVVTNNVDTDNIENPIFNREFIPNPAFSGSGDISKQFSVVSYNILADCHLFRNDYSFTDSKYLVPEYRLEKIIEELKYLDADVICMQEVDPSFFSEKLLPSLQSIGYEGFHKKRTEEYFKEGEATFYKTGRFTIVECQLQRQADLVEKVLTEGSVDTNIQESVRKYVDMPDVVVVTKLRCNNTGSELTVGNVHINWGEMKTPDIQCVQIASAIKEAVNKAGNEGIPHIICGDFNSPPLSPGYVVARDGYPNGDETITKLQQITGLQLPEGKVDSLVNCLWPAFQHTSSSLKSAYFEVQGQEPEITSYNQVMCECVDYIFYSSTSIDNVGVYRVPAKDKIMETGGTPNQFFPSDHVSMKAVLSFK